MQSYFFETRNSMGQKVWWKGGGAARVVLIQSSRLLNWHAKCESCDSEPHFVNGISGWRWCEIQLPPCLETAAEDSGLEANASVVALVLRGSPITKILGLTNKQPKTNESVVRHTHTITSQSGSGRIIPNTLSMRVQSLLGFCHGWLNSSLPSKLYLLIAW